MTFVVNPLFLNHGHQFGEVVVSEVLLCVVLRFAVHGGRLENAQRIDLVNWGL